MAVLQFTKLSYPGLIRRRYGDLTISASSKDCWIKGYHAIIGKHSGDKELDVLKEQILGAWSDHVTLADGVDAPTKFERHDLTGGRMEHPQMGHVAGYKTASRNLVMKVTKKLTEIEAEDFHIVSAEHASALTSALQKLIEDRSHVRQFAAPAATT